MIEFVTLFLGFIAGTHRVEMTVDGPVARVEIRLDGDVAARLDAPPWTAEVDFGPELVPHRLEALAYDAAGRFLARTERLINLARGNYEASLVLAPAGAGGRRSGHLRWGAVLGQDPAAVELAFDGRHVPVDERGRFVLPPHDAAASHALTARVDFPDGASTRAELAFGGVFGDRVTSALTAVPVTSPPGRPWTKDDVAAWFEKDGVALEVFAARAAPGRLVVVRDTTVVSRLARLPPPPPDPDLEDFRVVAVSPRPLAAHAGTFELVELGTAERLSRREPWRLAERTLFGRERREKRQRLWDALAVAGRDAASSQRPRAVLLLAGAPARDKSRFSAARAARYLGSVRVPLFVWTPEGVEVPVPVPDATRRASGTAELEALFGRIARELTSQTVVWLEGEHLPGEIASSAAAPAGVELVR